jgi:hypothetical protein
VKVVSPVKDRSYHNTGKIAKPSNPTSRDSRSMSSSYLSQCIAEQRRELRLLMQTDDFDDTTSRSPSPQNTSSNIRVSSSKSMQGSTTGSYTASRVALFDSMARKHTDDEPSALPAAPKPYELKHSALPTFNGNRDDRDSRDLSVDRSSGYTANSDGGLLGASAQVRKPYTAHQTQPPSPPPHMYTSAFSASMDVRQSTASSATAASADEAVSGAHLSALRQGAGSYDTSNSKYDSPKQLLRSSNGHAAVSFTDAASSTGSRKGPAWEPASLNTQQLRTGGSTALHGGNASSSGSRDNFGLSGRYSSAEAAAAATTSPRQQQQQYEEHTDHHQHQHDDGDMHELDGRGSVQQYTAPRKQQQLNGTDHYEQQQQQGAGYMNGHSSSSKASEAEQEAHRNRYKQLITFITIFFVLCTVQQCMLHVSSSTALSCCSAIV